ncbi:MAG TPA: glycosyltransferase family 2 protein [Candidatus Saccharimonadales bacterium]|nr:glycosyltransferase family 2 protein [Candidatus Saccharimonadales bacterium]
MHPSVSIVIPVYNEADQLAACLQAIAAQKVQPLEVIVVDNNSTDNSAAIAASFPFVKLLHEPRQGVVYARSRGFDAARGDIIGRIDADTRLNPDWVERLQKLFEDPALAAVSGAPHYFDFPFRRLADGMDAIFRQHLANCLGDMVFLWGANMALRRSAWQQVRSEVCFHNYQHEDFDLGIHLQRQGLRVNYDASLIAPTSSRRVDMRFPDFVRYTLMSPKTYKQHGLLRRLHMYPVLFVTWTFYVPARLLYRAYDPVTERFSLNQLFQATAQRIDPTTNVV